MSDNPDSPERFIHPKLTRRGFLIGAGTATAGMALGEVVLHVWPHNQSSSEPTPQPEQDAPEYFPDLQDKIGVKFIKNVESKDTFANLVRVANPETLDQSYLQKLIAELEKPKSTIAGRITSLTDNVHKIATVLGEASCLKIDESGIFLAAGHTLGSNPQNTFEPLRVGTFNLVTDPNTEKVYLITDFLILPGIDNALVYAPTGLPKKAVANLQILDQAIEPAANLWMYGLYEKYGSDDRPLSYNVGLQNGVFAGYFQSGEQQAYNDMFKIDKMPPGFGGASGSPITDRQGRIVGTLSGTIPLGKIPEGEKYTGSTAAKVRGIKTLVEKWSESHTALQVKALP